VFRLVQCSIQFNRQSIRVDDIQLASPSDPPSYRSPFTISKDLLQASIDIPDQKEFPNLDGEQFDDIVNFFIFMMVNMEGSKVVLKAGSCMMSQQEIRPTCQSQYPSNIFVSHVLGDMEYASYQEMIDAEGLMQCLMRNNCGDKWANVRTDKGNPKSGTRLISEENPGKIYVALTNCKTKGEFDDKFQSYYMKQKVRSNVEVDENGRKLHLSYFSGRKMHPTYASGRRRHLIYGNGRRQHLTEKTGRKLHLTYGNGRRLHLTEKTGRRQHLTYGNGRRQHPTNKTGRRPHPTKKTGRKPYKQTLVKKDDKYSVKCEHCDTVRSVNKAPVKLYCKGDCKKNYVCNLELGSNEHWEVIAEADDREEQQENGIESDDGDGDFEFEMDISEFVPSIV